MVGKAGCALYDINRAFDGPLDTLSWEADDDAEFPLGKLTVKGQVDIEEDVLRCSMISNPKWLFPKMLRWRMS